MKAIKAIRFNYQEIEITKAFNQLIVRGPEPINFNPNAAIPIRACCHMQNVAPMHTAHIGSKKMRIIDPYLHQPDGYQLFYARQLGVMGLKEEITLAHSANINRAWKV